MPDKVLAFDELPDKFLVGLDMIKAEGFPRHWKDWMGKSKKIMRIPPDKNPLTGEVRTYKPIEEEDYFFYTVDWNIRAQEDRWKEITDYVRLNAPEDLRLPEDLIDLAKPLAQDKLAAIDLEPEDVVIISLKKAADLKDKKEIKSEKIFKCEEPGCTAEFEGSYGKNSLRMHTSKKHKKEAVSA